MTRPLDADEVLAHRPRAPFGAPTCDCTPIDGAGVLKAWAQSPMCPHHGGHDGEGWVPFDPFAHEEPTLVTAPTDPAPPDADVTALRARIIELENDRALYDAALREAVATLDRRTEQVARLETEVVVRAREVAELRAMREAGR